MGETRLKDSQIIKICRVVLNADDACNDVSAVMLRGFFGNLFVDDPEFHHHSEKSYHYPLIQYKKVDGKMIIVGLQEHSTILMNRVASVDRITTPQRNYDISSKEIDIMTHILRESTSLYEFATPWIPLNEENYKAFKEMDEDQRKGLLERILVGNILSCLKGLGIFVDYRVTSRITWFRPMLVRAHGNPFEAFQARFYLNIDIPDYIGLGKSVSKGFGAIRRVS